MCRRSRATISGTPTTAPTPKRYSRAALIGVIAAREAWIDAGLRIAEPNAGVVIGSGGGGIDVGERQYYDFFVERGRKVTPYAIPVSIVGMVSSEISISLRLRGISHVLSCGCTSSTDAIGYAANQIRSGELDVVLSGSIWVRPLYGYRRHRYYRGSASGTPLWLRLSPSIVRGSERDDDVTPTFGVGGGAGRNNGGTAV